MLFNFSWYILVLTVRSALIFEYPVYALLQYLLSYLVIHNLGQNKMEQQTPIPPPNQGWSRTKEKTHYLPIFDLGVRGSLVFPFILSTVVACIIDVINPLTRGLVPSSSFLFSLCLLFCTLSFFGHDLCEKSNEKCNLIYYGNRVASLQTVL